MNSLYKKRVFLQPFKCCKNTRHGPSDRIRTCGILLPKQARYQLRYTRLFRYFIRLVVFSQSKRATNCANPGFLVIEFCARCGQTCGQAVFLTISACGGSACIVGVSRDCSHGIFQLEGGATRSQTRRDTNFAIPGYSLFCHDTTASGKNKVISVCGHLCGQSRFCAVFSNRDKSRKRRASLTKPCYYTACSARLQGLFVVCGPFFRIFGANALHGLVLLTYLIV